MARLPTVKLVHKRTGATKIVNATDYQANLNGWPDYTILGVRRGDATTEQVVEDAAQKEIERQRRTAPTREARFGDKERAQKTASMPATQNVVTEVPFKDRPFAELKELAETKTGTKPRNKAHALRLLEA